MSTEKQTTNNKSSFGKDVGVDRVRLFSLPLIEDTRGNLSFAEYDQALPFIPKRYFLIFDVPGRKVRGEHAHRECEQFLVCVKGSCSVIVDDGQNRAEVLLDQPNLGLYLPALTWGVQHNYSSEGILMVLASHKYDSHDYIREYDEFIKIKSCK